MKAHEFIACPRERYKQGETSRDGFSYIKGVVSNEQGETRYWVLECFRGGLQTGSVAPISYMFSVEELSAYVIEVGSRMVDYSFRANFEPSNDGYYLRDYTDIKGRIPVYEERGGEFILKKAGSPRRVTRGDRKTFICIDSLGKLKEVPKVELYEIDSEFNSCKLKSASQYDILWELDLLAFRDSDEFKLAEARNKLTGADCAVYHDVQSDIAGGLSVVGFNRTETGICRVSGATTSVNCGDEDFSKSGVEVLSLEDCKYIKYFSIKHKGGIMLKRLSVIFPNNPIKFPYLSIIKFDYIEEVKLLGEIPNLSLDMSNNRLNISDYIMQKAHSLRFNGCSGISKVICNPFVLKLCNTDTEYVSCSLRPTHGSPFSYVIIKGCHSLRYVRIDYGRFSIREFSDSIQDCPCLEELCVTMEAIYLFYYEADSRVIDLAGSFPKLKKVIFSALWGVNVIDERYALGKWKLVVPADAEVMLSEVLEGYFTVVRK